MTFELKQLLPWVTEINVVYGVICGEMHSQQYSTTSHEATYPPSHRPGSGDQQGET